jgi:hypothetical protein
MRREPTTRIQIKQITRAVRNDIAFHVGKFTVILIGIRYKDGCLEFEQSGGGTLVTALGWPFILTAAHVWQHVAKFDQIGIIIRNGDNHFSLPRDVFRAEYSKRRSEAWGPDLAFIRIPSEFKGLIESQHKVFYNLDKRRKNIINGKRELKTGVWVLAGAPAESSVREELSLKMRGMVGLTGIDRILRKGKYDYLDCSAVYLRRSTVPKSFRGVSGGGLWHVELRRNPKSRRMRMQGLTLEGVAFCQLRRLQNRRRIRSHGRVAIYLRGFELARRLLAKRSPSSPPP